MKPLVENNEKQLADLFERQNVIVMTL